MAAPTQDAPCVIRIDQNGSTVMEITDAEGEVHDYLVEYAPEGLGEWACVLRRLDGQGGPYRVARGVGGRWTCDCRDAKFRARKGGRLCKHRLAVQKDYARYQRLFPRHES